VFTTFNDIVIIVTLFFMYTPYSIYTI